MRAWTVWVPKPGYVGTLCLEKGGPDVWHLSCPKAHFSSPLPVCAAGYYRTYLLLSLTRFPLLSVELGFHPVLLVNSPVAILPVFTFSNQFLLILRRICGRPNPTSFLPLFHAQGWLTNRGFLLMS